MSQKPPRLTRQSVLLLVFLAVVLVFITNFRMSMVQGASMEPTFVNGQLLLVNLRTLFRPYLHRKDVVIIQRERREVIIKRVYLLPGDEVKAGEPYLLQMNRARFLLDYYDQKTEKTATGRITRYYVPQGYIVVLGDNAKVSEDSRFFGPVSIKDVIGTVAGRTERPADSAAPDPTK